MIFYSNGKYPLSFKDASSIAGSRLYPFEYPPLKLVKNKGKIKYKQNYTNQIKV